MKNEKPLDFSVEFREGASNENELERQDQFNKSVRELYANYTDVDWAQEFAKDALNLRNPFSETLIIDSTGKFNKIIDINQNALYFGGAIKANSPTEFYKLAKDIQDKYPEYKFDFTIDPEGKWFKYTLSK